MQADREHFSVTQARRDLAIIFDEVNYQKKRIILTNHRQSIAMVPIEDLKLLEALEDEIDNREADKALKDVQKNGTLSFEEVVKELGLEDEFKDSL